MKSVLVSAALFAGAMAGVCHAPVPSYDAKPEPSYEAKPEPSYEAKPESSATPAPASGPGYFGVTAVRSASPIHFQPLTARGGKFYLGGGPPSSYCPPNVCIARSGPCCSC